MKEFLVNLSWLWIWDSKKRREYRNNYRRYKYYKMPDIIPNHYDEKYIYSAQWGNDLISKELKKHDKKPYLISRFGAVELCCIKYALENIEKPTINFPENIKKLMKTQAGFFSANDEQLTRFICESIEAVKNTDILGVWNFNDDWEKNIVKKYNQSVKLVSLTTLGEDLFFFENPWTQLLQDKKVLIIHPFEKTIIEQYAKRELLHKNTQILPQFELKTLKAVQGISQKDTANYKDWFSAFDSMCEKIENIDFDVALIAAGAYGMLLGNFIKNIGKQAIHAGGALQLLFGIKGSRWTQNQNLSKKIFNENWVFPNSDETPKDMDNFVKNENSLAYW